MYSAHTFSSSQTHTNMHSLSLFFCIASYVFTEKRAHTQGYFQLFSIANYPICSSLSKFWNVSRDFHARCVAIILLFHWRWSLFVEIITKLIVVHLLWWWCCYAMTIHFVSMDFDWTNKTKSIAHVHCEFGWAQRKQFARDHVYQIPIVSQIKLNGSSNLDNVWTFDIHIQHTMTSTNIANW